MSMRATGASSLGASRALTVAFATFVRTSAGGDEEVPVDPRDRGDGRNHDHDFVGPHHRSVPGVRGVAGVFDGQGDLLRRYLVGIIT